MPKTQTSIPVGRFGLTPGQVGYLIEEDDTRPGGTPSFHLEPVPLRDSNNKPTLNGVLHHHRLKQHGGGGYTLKAHGVVRVVRLCGQVHDGMTEEEMEKVKHERQGMAIVETLTGDELKNALKELSHADPE